MITQRSCPDLRPIVVRRSAPQPRLLAGVQRNRPPLTLQSARCTCQNVCLNHAGGSFGGWVAALLIATPPLARLSTTTHGQHERYDVGFAARRGEGPDASRRLVVLALSTRGDKPSTTN